MFQIASLNNYLAPAFRLTRQANTNQNEKYFTELRRREYGRLDGEKQVYLDYTGGNVHPESLLREHFTLLRKSVLGNPHSVNPTSHHASILTEEARRAVLEFFKATDEYYCIFTPNATGALKIVGECFPWAHDSQYLLTADNHNSVHGIREYCTRAGGNFQYAPLGEDLSINAKKLNQLLERPAGRAPRLFAFPGQSNSSGVRHATRWVEQARKRGWRTLFDAAALAPSSPINLSAIGADFMCVSFYKLFGYPTGIGALLVRKDAFKELKKPWFAGGTVQLSTVGAPAFRTHDNHERFENGTIDYLNLPAVASGLKYLGQVGMPRLSNYLQQLGAKLNQELRDLCHPNGQPRLKVYGPADRKNCGANFLFNVLDDRGNIVPFATVEAAAAAQGISLRAGCFCNPGVDEAIHGVAGEALERLLANNPQASFADLARDNDTGRGAVRVSLGVATVRKDLNALISFLNGF